VLYVPCHTGEKLGCQGDKFWEGELLRVHEYRVMRFSEVERVRRVDHIACMWCNVPIGISEWKTHFGGSSHRWDYCRTALDLKGKGLLKLKWISLGQITLERK
jgi:hypothetical protein